MHHDLQTVASRKRNNRCPAVFMCRGRSRGAAHTRGRCRCAPKLCACAHDPGSLGFTHGCSGWARAGSCLAVVLGRMVQTMRGGVGVRFRAQGQGVGVGQGWSGTERAGARVGCASSANRRSCMHVSVSVCELKLQQPGTHRIGIDADDCERPLRRSHLVVVQHFCNLRDDPRMRMASSHGSPA